jgi:hypothetical protein
MKITHAPRDEEIKERKAVLACDDVEIKLTETASLLVTSREDQIVAELRKLNDNILVLIKHITNL